MLWKYFLCIGVIGMLPIFARKRPRVALMAFSSSQSPVTTPGRANTSLNVQEHVQERNYFTPCEKENYQHYGGTKPVANWRYEFEREIYTCMHLISTRPHKPPPSGHVTRPALPQASTPQWDTSRDSFNDTASSINFAPTHGIPSTKVFSHMML